MSDLRPPASDEETTNALIRTLRASDFKNTEIFKLIRDFFFELSPRQFEELSRRMCAALIVKLSDALTYQIKQENSDKQENSQYNQNIFSLLTFLGYKISYSATNIEQINTIIHHFPNFGYLETQLFIKIFQSTFDTKEKESDFLNAVKQVVLPLSCKQLSLTLNQPKNVNSLQFITFRSLLQLLQANCARSDKINEQFQAIIFKFISNTSKDLKLGENFIQNISYIAICIQVACVVFLPTFREAKLKESIDILTEITKVIPLTLSTLIDEIYQAIKFLLKTAENPPPQQQTQSQTQVTQNQGKAQLTQKGTKNAPKAPKQTKKQQQAPNPTNNAAGNTQKLTPAQLALIQKQAQQAQQQKATDSTPSNEEKKENVTVNSSSVKQEGQSTPTNLVNGPSKPPLNSQTISNLNIPQNTLQKLTPAQQQKLQQLQLQQKAQQIQQQQIQQKQLQNQSAQNIAFLQKQKESIIKRLDLLNDFYPFVFSFKSMTPELFDKQIALVYKIIETVIKFQHHIATWMTKFCKFTANIILYQGQSYTKKTEYFYHLLKLVKVPSDNSIRPLIIELFFVTINLQINEIEYELLKLSNENSAAPNMNEAKLLIKKFNSLVECLNRCIRGFDTFLKFTRNATMVKQNPLYTFYDPNINQNTSELISTIFSKIFYSIELSRKILEITAFWLPDFSPEENFEKNVKILKDINIFKLSQTKIITLHQTNIQFVIQALENATPPLIDSAWRLFFHTFFYTPSQNLQFNASLFSALSLNHKAFSIFMRNLVSFIEDNLDHAFIIEKMLSSLYILFDKISQRTPSAPMIISSQTSIANQQKGSINSRPATPLTPAQIALIKAKQAQALAQQQANRSQISRPQTPSTQSSSNTSKPVATLIGTPNQQTSTNSPKLQLNTQKVAQTPSNVPQKTPPQTPIKTPPRTATANAPRSSSNVQINPLTAKFIESIISSSFNLINISKEFLQSKKHSASSLGLLIAVTKFIDRVCGNENFSQVIYKPISVHEICETIAITKESGRIIPKFVQRSLEIFLKFYKIRVTLPLINLLIRTSAYNQTDSYKLLIQCYKLDIALFSQSPFLQRFSNYLYTQLDNANEDNKKLILKLINHLPQHLNIYDFDASHYFIHKMAMRFELSSNNEKYDHLNFPLFSFYMAITKSLVNYPDNKDCWKMLTELNGHLFNDDIDADIEYRQFLQLVLSESFSDLLPDRNERIIEHGKISTNFKHTQESNQKNNKKRLYYEHFLDNVADERKELALAHFITCFLQYVDNLDIKNQAVYQNMFSFIQTPDQLSRVIKEIMLLATQNLISNSLILLTICELFIYYIPLNLLQKNSLVFYEFLICVVTKNTTQRWKEKQKIENRMNFIELDLLPDRIQNILIFARDQLKIHQLADIMTLFNESKSTQNFLVNLLIAELLSSYESTVPSNPSKKYVDFGPIIEELEDNELTFFRVLGPLFRSMPKAFENIFSNIYSKFEEKLKNISSRDKNYQANFLVLAVPILKHLEEAKEIQDFKPLISVCFQFFDRPTSYITCQAQLFIKELYHKNVPQIQTEILSLMDTFLKNKRFIATVRPLDFNAVSWKLTTNSLFSIVYVNTKLFIDAMQVYLEQFPQTIKNASLQDKIKPEFLYENLVELFKLASSKLIINFALKNDLYMKLIRAMLTVLTLFPVTQKPLLNYLSVFISLGLSLEEDDNDPNGEQQEEKLRQTYKPSDFFNALLKEGLQKGTFIQVFSLLSLMKNLEPLYTSFVKEYKKDILQLFQEKSNKNSCQQFHFARILINLNYTETDEDFVKQLFDVHHDLVKMYTNHFETFDGILFKHLTEYICIHFPNQFLLSTYMFDENDPIFITFFNQTLENYFDFSVLEKDFFKNICKELQEKADSEGGEEYQISHQKNYFVNLLAIVIQQRKDLLNIILKFMIEEFDSGFCVGILNDLYTRGIKIDYTLFDPLQVYDSCSTEDDKIEALYFWKNSESEEHFLILFQNMCSFIHFHMDSRIRNILATMKIPRGVDEEMLSIQILNVFQLYSRSSQVAPLLFAFLSNNRRFFSRLTLTFLEPIQNHLRYIETFSKKPQIISSLIPLYKDIVHCIVFDGDCGLTEQQKQALGFHVTSAGIPIVRVLLEQTDIKVHLELRELMKAVGAVTKLFPTSSLPTYFFKQLIMYHMSLKEMMQSNNSQGNGQPTSNQTVQLPRNSKERFFFELFIEGISKMVNGITQNSDSPDLEQILGIFVETIQTKETIIWPSVIYSLTKVLKSPKWRDRAIEKIRPVLTPDYFNRTMLLYFHYLPYIEDKNYDFIFQQLRIIYTKESKAHIPEIIIYYIYQEMNSYIMEYMVSLFLSPNAGSFEAFLLHCAFRPEFKGCSFVRRFIDCLRNKKLALAYFNRETPSDEIINLLPLEALMILSTKQTNVPQHVLDKIRNTYDFNEVIHACIGTQRLNIPFALLLSTFTGNDLMRIIPFLIISQDLPEQCYSLYKENRIRDLKIHSGINALSSSDQIEKQKKFSLEVLSEFPDFGFFGEERIPDAEIYNSLSMFINSIKDIGNINFSYPFDSPISSPILEEQKGHNILLDNIIGDTKILHLISNESTIEKKLDKIFSHCAQLSLTATRKGLGEFLIIHEVKRIARALKRHKDNFKAFRYTLKPSLSPQLHYFYKQIRDVTCSKFTVANSKQIDDIHMKKFLKSVKLHNEEQYNYLFSLDAIKEQEKNLLEDADSCEKNIHKLMISLYNDNTIEPEHKENCAIVLLKKKKNDAQEPYLLLIQNYKQYPKLMKKIHASKIPFSFSPLFVDMISEDSELQTLIPQIHPSFMLSLLCANCEIPSDTKYKINSFLNPVLQAANSDEMKLMKKVHKYSTKVVSSFRSNKKVSLPKEFGRKCDDLCEQILLSKSFAIRSTPIDSIVPPLSECAYAETRALTFSVKSQTTPEITINCLLSNGETVVYKLSPRMFMTHRLALFFSLINKLFRKYHSTSRRGQEILALNSLEVSKDVFLTVAQSNSLYDLSSLQVLTEAYKRTSKSGKNHSQAKDNKAFHYKTTPEFAFWFSLAGHRYSVVSLVQMVSGSSMPSPLDISFDLPKASFAIGEFTKDSGEKSIPRLCGKITQYIDRTVAMGPYRIGILSAAECLNYNKSKLQILLSSLLEEESFEEKSEKIISQFSVVCSGPSSALDSATTLIETSYNCDQPFAIPWI